MSSALQLKHIKFCIWVYFGHISFYFSDISKVLSSCHKEKHNNDFLKDDSLDFDSILVKCSKTKHFYVPKQKVSVDTFKNSSS